MFVHLILCGVRMHFLRILIVLTLYLVFMPTRMCELLCIIIVSNLWEIRPDPKSLRHSITPVNIILACRTNNVVIIAGLQFSSNYLNLF